MRTVLASTQKRYVQFAIVVMTCLLSIGAAAIAQESPTLPQATTTSDPAISVDHLRVILRPLTKAELEIELRGWIGLLRAKITEVGDVEIAIQSATQGDSGADVTDQLLALRTEETDLVQRASMVLDALEAKGGDVVEAQQFIAAVSDISETTDTASYRAALYAAATNWVGRDDGGKFWAKRGLLAAVILFVFWLISKFAGRLTARALARHPRASNLLENFARRTAGGIVLVVGLLMALSVLG